ncbi:MAG: putative transcriptional regulator [Acidimicrobiia bacterium]|nr:putative transcriptional regulator [Acidimicrobiia bacterium]
MPASVQQTAEALGGSTRYEVFRLVADAGCPMAISELAAALGVHGNAVRPHLARLVRAGLIHERLDTRPRRGRPRLMYTPVAGTADRWAEFPPYQQLSVLLAEVLSTGDSPRSVGRRAATVLPGPTARPVQAVVSELVRQGCQPRATTRGQDTAVVLQGCPFPEAAAANRTVVCAIHMGLLEGLADSLPGVRVVSLEPADPHLGTCRLHLRSEPEPQSVAPHSS